MRRHSWLFTASRDVIIPVGEARQFVERLRDVSGNPVGYVELPGAGHGFDLTDGTLTSAAVRAIGLFLNHIHQTRPAPSRRGRIATLVAISACSVTLSATSHAEVTSSRLRPTVRRTRPACSRHSSQGRAEHYGRR